MSSILTANFIVEKLKRASLEVDIVKVYENENLLIPIIYREEVKSIPEFAFSLYENTLKKIEKIATEKTEEYFVLDTDKLLSDFPISDKQPLRYLMRKVSDEVEENFIDLSFIDIEGYADYYFPSPFEFVKFGINFYLLNTREPFDRKRILTTYKKEEKHFLKNAIIEEKIRSYILYFYFDEKRQTFDFSIKIPGNEKVFSYFEYSVDLVRRKNELYFLTELRVFPIVEVYVVNVDKLI